MKKKISRVLCGLLCATLVFLNSTMITQAKASTYVADKDDELIPMPDAYEVQECIYSLGDYGILNHPQDIFVSENFYYVADTENNRVLKFAKTGSVMQEYTQAFDKNLKSPSGIFVDEENNIWIADTGNLRIVVITQTGESVCEYGKPDSNLLSENFSFDAQKIAVNSIGYIYALKGANLMQIDGANNFRGYLGATDVGFSLSRLLIRTFGSQSQIERTLKQEPAAYSNFMLGDDGMIYGVLATQEKDQIRRLNSVGNNTYPEDTYGFVLEKEGSEEPVQPFFSDIAVFHNGIITVVDKNTGLLYQYDQAGNLLAAFGGIGSYEGTYAVPISIAADRDGKLYVLDYSTGTITILKPTEFISLVHEAVSLYDAGKYEEAKVYWQKVIDIDSNYALAHQGLGKVLFKEEDYEESLHQYYLGEDKDGYSISFSEYRHELFRDYFIWVVLLAGGILYGLYRCINVAKDAADKWANIATMGGDLK